MRCSKFTDGTPLNSQNQDLELDNLRNDYAEIGPHANNGNKGSFMLNEHNELQKEEVINQFRKSEYFIVGFETL